MCIKFVKASNVSQHVDTIYNLIYKCGQDMYNNDGLSHWKNGYSRENIERDISEKEVYLVTKEHDFVGCFMITTSASCFFTDINRNKYIYISKLAIDPRVSGKGIGSKSIKFCELFAIERQLKGIRLDVYSKSKKAIKFYENLGFIRGDIKDTRHFQVLCMEKVIKGAYK